MNCLVLEPREPRGLRIALMTHAACTAEVILEPLADPVRALRRVMRTHKKIDEVVVRGGIGSFSASRSALVMGSAMSALRGIPLRVITRASRAVKKFQYAAPPHITMPGKNKRTRKKFSTTT